MKKVAFAAAVLSAVIATPVLAAPGGEGRVEVRGGLMTGDGNGEATVGLAAGYDFDLGDSLFVGAEVSGDAILVDAGYFHLFSGGRIGTKVGTNGKLYATGGVRIAQFDEPYAGAGYQHKITSNVFAKAEYRHHFNDNVNDYDTFVVGVGFAF